MCIWNGPLQNLNWSLKNQKSELFVWNLMVKYWSDRIKFWIYTAFRAFPNLTPAFVISLLYTGGQTAEFWFCTNNIGSIPFDPFLNFVTVLRDGEMNNIIILPTPKKPCAFLHSILTSPHFKSDIRKDNRRSHVKLDNILFYFFKKEKMKWNEMRTKPCVE